MNSFLLSPNSFKDCINSVDLTNLLYNNLIFYNKNLLKWITFYKKPISDGGDGFLDVCKFYFNLSIKKIKLISLDNVLKTIEIGYDKVNRIVFVESANIIGKKSLVNSTKLNPYVFTSLPLGILLNKLDRINRKEKIIDKCIIGIGGTITSDMGLGMLIPFNLKLKRNKRDIKIIPAKYILADTINYEKPELSFDIEIITDVQNPLLGNEGAVYAFGPQKGISNKHLSLFEIGFKNICKILNINKINNFSGAGGGIAFGLQYFFNAKTISSKEFILNKLKIAEIKADMVLTGEGSFDNTSLLNKGTAIIINYANEIKAKKIFVITGKSSKIKDDKLNILSIEDYFKSEEESKKYIKFGIKKISKQIINEILREENGK